ncbi:hypothetical protein NKR23_g107 [Pleurostoma richardsiae]|uniref:Uncharacterized protein n=1 Tax=Pleurostoma richardsiae TaxID=41990 RepID=A0AA38RUR5_9PEZI|nr:hypothetical protein NKR23_g107 [Pleurostoma richardsiae]
MYSKTILTTALAALLATTAVASPISPRSGVAASPKQARQNGGALSGLLDTLGLGNAAGDATSGAGGLVDTLTSLLGGGGAADATAGQNSAAAGDDPLAALTGLLNGASGGAGANSTASAGALQGLLSGAKKH